MGLSANDGTLSPDEFRCGAQSFAEKWKTVSHSHDLPLWSWVTCPTSLLAASYYEVGGYLSLEKMCISSSNKIDSDDVSNSGKDDPECLDDEEVADPAVLVQEADHEHYYDFHIIYSNSYMIPVLYFRGYNREGQSLILDQIERDLPTDSAKSLSESKWTFITQQEHPYLNRPWFTLHPCGTNELMKLLLSEISMSKIEVSAERYLVSWFSVVSQVVGLRVPLQLAAV